MQIDTRGSLCILPDGGLAPSKAALRAASCATHDRHGRLLYQCAVRSPLLISWLSISVQNSPLIGIQF